MERSIIQKDYFRHSGRWVRFPAVRTIFNKDFRHTYLLRKIADKKTFFLSRVLYKIYFKHFSGRLKHQISPETSIGEGLYMVHAYNVIINPKVVVGKNCNIAHGVIIGNSTKIQPVIGNEVWIGACSVIEGNITIGNNVLIAPKSYVNFNVPDNSVVIGNPSKIIRDREDATLDYINNTVH